MKATFFLEKNTITFNNKKTNNPLMAKFWVYVLGWVAISTQKLGRFDISYPAYDYLKEFQGQDHGGFATSEQWGLNDDTMDIITSAQLGRLAIYFGQIPQATKAGDFLKRQFARLVFLSISSLLLSIYPKLSTTSKLV
jgi:hypothetical protein